MNKILVVALAAAASTLGSNAGHATTIAVAVTELGQVVASWDQDQNPDPMAWSKGYYTTVPIWNAVGLDGDDAISWYSNSQLGGFTNYSENFNVLAQTSYAADESTPTFLPGLYTGVDIKPNLTYILASYTITLLPDPVFKPAFASFSAPASDVAVPEPATWAMMIVGMGVIGLAARRRQMATVTYG